MGPVLLNSLNMDSIKDRFRQLRNQERIGYLIAGFITHTLTIEEEEELDAWIVADEKNMQLFEDMTEEKQVAKFLQWLSTRDTEARLEEVKKRIRLEKKGNVVSIWKYAAAAVILLMVGLGVYTLFYKEKAKDVELASNTVDIQPGSAQAILRLPNGSVVALDANNDTVINSEVRIKDGEVINDGSSTDTARHLISIPRKGFYKVVLPDGSKVWLNSESSISYPGSFGSKERRVVVTGETYFEVAKDPAHPFIVSVNNVDVKALGTAFNIKAYSNEDVLKVTLIEGAVKVTGKTREEVLAPNQQLQVNAEQWQLRKMDETGHVTSWVKNEFRFTDETIEEIARELERWYDVQIEIKEKIEYHFHAHLSRNLPISDILKLLEATDHVHFTITEGTITVTR